MRGALWWIDRWRQSRAFADMSAEEQGLYRNLCDELWIRPDHVIPDEPRILAKASGDHEAWARSGEKVLRWMRRGGGGWTNNTALEVIDQSQKRAERQKRYRNAGSNGPRNEPRNPIIPPYQDQEKDQEQSPEAGRKEDEQADLPPQLPPADRTEKALRESTDFLRTKLYAVIDRTAHEDPEHRDPTELMRLVTGYERKDGAKVQGVVNAGLMTYERLEKSIGDAEWHLEEWNKRAGRPEKR